MWYMNCDPKNETRDLKAMSDAKREEIEVFSNLHDHTFYWLISYPHFHDATLDRLYVYSII